MINLSRVDFVPSQIFVTNILGESMCSYSFVKNRYRKHGGTVLPTRPVLSGVNTYVALMLTRIHRLNSASNGRLAQRSAPVQHSARSNACTTHRGAQLFSSSSRPLPRRISGRHLSLKISPRIHRAAAPAITGAPISAIDHKNRPPAKWIPARGGKRNRARSKNIAEIRARDCRPYAV